MRVVQLSVCREYLCSGHSDGGGSVCEDVVLEASHTSEAGGLAAKCSAEGQ